MKEILIGALFGLATAMAVDIDAWNKAKQAADQAWYDGGAVGDAPVVAFEWRTAWPRWMVGAIIGAAGGAGMNV